ncbi:MAG: hypothetical protein ACREHG_06600, partial [Candidatus Saccharimonadales bacterium]
VVHVVRDFKDASVTHVGDGRDPSQDISTINTELALADLQTMEKRSVKFSKEVKSDPKLKPLLKVYEEVQEVLKRGDFLRGLDIDWDLLNDLHLLSAKPIIYLFNTDEDTLGSQQKQKDLAALVEPAKALFVCAKLEDELRQLDETEATELLLSYGQRQSGLAQVIKAAYEILGLQSFLTAVKRKCAPGPYPVALPRAKPPASSIRILNVVLLQQT